MCQNHSLSIFRDFSIYIYICFPYFNGSWYIRKFISILSCKCNFQNIIFSCFKFCYRYTFTVCPLRLNGITLFICSCYIFRSLTFRWCNGSNCRCCNIPIFRNFRLFFASYTKFSCIDKFIIIRCYFTFCTQNFELDICNTLYRLIKSNGSLHITVCVGPFSAFSCFCPGFSIVSGYMYITFCNITITCNRTIRFCSWNISNCTYGISGI